MKAGALILNWSIDGLKNQSLMKKKKKKKYELTFTLFVYISGYLKCYLLFLKQKTVLRKKL